ncbi:hypothetical protein PV325_000377 [Microctonus aethiopoides]|nr:hypothetical protein PV325_000377 [Microctonus aethiopoides]
MGTPEEEKYFPVQELSKEPKSKLTCANCGEQGHPASYMGCPYLKMAQDLKKNNHLKRQETKRITIIRQASFVRTNTSYASLFHTTVEGRSRLTTSSNQPMGKLFSIRASVKQRSTGSVRPDMGEQRLATLGVGRSVEQWTTKGPTTDVKKRQRDNEISDESVAN